MYVSAPWIRVSNPVNPPRMIILITCDRPHGRGMNHAVLNGPAACPWEYLQVSLEEYRQEYLEEYGLVYLEE